jgi:hypothetical protein
MSSDKTKLEDAGRGERSKSEIHCEVDRTSSESERRAEFVETQSRGFLYNLKCIGPVSARVSRRSKPERHAASELVVSLGRSTETPVSRQDCIYVVGEISEPILPGLPPLRAMNSLAVC